MSVWETIESTRLDQALKSLRLQGQNMGPTMREIASLGESQTRMRFVLQRAPGGIPWKPSLRALLTGGRTLVKDRHLLDSISSGYGSTYAEWGVNRVYAAIQNYGGQAGRGKKVTISRRTFLGLDRDNEESMLNAVERRLNNATGASGVN